MQPDVLLKSEKEDALPTQLYVSVDAPNEELFKKIDNPLLKDGWQRLQKTLSLLPKYREKARTSLRFTIIRGMNDCLPEKWAEIIKLAQPLFVEVKAYMAVGYSRERLGMDYMPRHHEITMKLTSIAQITLNTVLCELPS